MLTTITSFADKINHNLSKQSINTLQINLGKICNLACNHCHVEAGPHRIEEMSVEICEQLIAIIERFPQIKTVDLTGGAPEMNYGFQQLVEVSNRLNKEIIVRSNLTIYLLDGFQYLPAYCAENQMRIVASLPCYLENNVDKIRGKGVYHDSIQAIQLLNELGYAKDPNLILDLVYNPALPQNHNFSLTPDQVKLEQDYKKYLRENFYIEFNHLLTITNLPIGRTKFYLEHRHLYDPYLEFLEQNFNPVTIDNLMC
ncbi:MAG: arsenosugar biosynthesis radical SAM (seleno)protein ArsS, partial [Microcoleaceae cyanobacterium]